MPRVYFSFSSLASLQALWAALSLVLLASSHAAVNYTGTPGSQWTTVSTKLVYVVSNNASETSNAVPSMASSIMSAKSPAYNYSLIQQRSLGLDPGNVSGSWSSQYGYHYNLSFSAVSMHASMNLAGSRCSGCPTITSSNWFQRTRPGNAAPPASQAY